MKDSLSFIKQLLNRFSIGFENTRVSILLDDEKICFNQHVTRPDLITAIDSLENSPNGQENIHLLLHKLRTQIFSRTLCGHNPDASKVALLLWSGTTNNQDEFETKMTDLKNSNVKVITVEVGANENSEKFYNSDFKSDFESLTSLTDDVAQAGCVVN